MHATCRLSIDKCIPPKSGFSYRPFKTLSLWYIALDLLTYPYFLTQNLLPMNWTTSPTIKGYICKILDFLGLNQISDYTGVHMLIDDSVL